MTLNKIKLVTVFLIFATLNFHIFRVIDVRFGATVFVLYLVLALIAFHEHRRGSMQWHFPSSKYFWIPVVAFSFFYIAMSVSILQSASLSWLESALGLGRLNYVYPLIFCLFAVSLTSPNIAVFLRILFVLHICACLFLIFSVIFDNQSFLQNANFSFKFRDGLERYSTLYGSVAQTGFCLSIPLWLALNYRGHALARLLLCTVICVAVILSTSRAGFYNIPLAMGLYLLFGVGRLAKVKSIGILLVALVVLTPLFMYTFDIFDYYNYFLYKVAGINLLNTEYLISSSSPPFPGIADRLMYTVFGDLQQHFVRKEISISDLIYGIGFTGMGISLGLTQNMQPFYIHNGLYEILVAGGVFGLFSFIAVNAAHFWNLLTLERALKTNQIEFIQIRFFFGLSLLIFINIFLGGSVVHPNLIAVLWLCIAVGWSKQNMMKNL